MSDGIGQLQKLLIQADGKPLEASLRYALAQNNPARLAAVQLAVDFACNELEQNRQQKQKLSEDQLTTEICSMLKSGGFEATRETAVGGHCDLVINGRDQFLWIAEAKKHSDYQWLEKGFQQLCTRYSTGVFGQNHGDLIVYCFNANAKAILEHWRGELVKNNNGVSTELPDVEKLIFQSSHVQESSGMNLYVRHKVVSLHWNPKD